jgi:hypothetical protein
MTMAAKFARAFLAGLVLSCAVGQANAQRPAPAKSWTVDTAGGKPVATRRGGAMSSDARAELLGPVRREGPAMLDWIRTFARGNAATLGTVDLSAKDDVQLGTIAGQRVATAAYGVQTSAGSRYVVYAVQQNTPAGEPVIVIRSTFADVITMARAFRSSVETLMPYILTPMASMRTVQAVAMGAQPITSFRGLASAALPTADSATAATSTTTAAAPANADSATTAAVGAGINDAIALLDPPAGAATAPATTPASSARTPAGSRGSSPAASRTPSVPTSSLAAQLVKVVFYQFGDLQYHPIALFRDGTSFDIDEAPLERVDPAASRREHPTNWGRWRNVGATYYLSEANGGAERDYHLDDGFHTGFAAAEGTTLDGMYKSVSGSSMGETSTLLTTQIRFMPDGRFTSGRDFAAVGNGQTSGVTMAGGASSNSAGRYRVSGHRLVMTYESGVVKEYFFAFSSGGTPAVIDREMIFVGWTAYVK